MERVLLLLVILLYGCWSQSTAEDGDNGTKNNRHSNFRSVGEPDFEFQELSLLQDKFYYLLHIYRSGGDNAVSRALASLDPYDHNVVTSGGCDYYSEFRSIDGTCNNINNPRLGASKTPFNRLVPNNYGDGVNSPTGEGVVSGRTLTPARSVSLAVHLTNNNKTGEFSHLLAIFGQILDHDLTLTGEPVGEDGEEIEADECCEEEASFEGDLRECFPISTISDPVFTRTCIPNTRSAPVPPRLPLKNLYSKSGTCRTYSCFERSQINDVTSYLDGSAVYGSTNHMAARLREGRGGRLRISVGVNGETRLPLSDDNPEMCSDIPNSESECTFLAGDTRNTEQASLSSIHTLLLREHNRITDQLSNMNPYWQDERLYQTARKILIAVIQSITYEEFLPPLVGPSIVQQQALSLDSYLRTRPEYIDPTVVHEFSTAAFRFGHSLVRQTFSTPGSSAAKEEDISQLFSAFLRIDQVGNDVFLNGLSLDPASQGDRCMVTGLRDRLFDDELDLMSFNIQRGRDHGIGSYMQIRNRFRLRTFNSFDDMVGVTHDMETVNDLRRVYKTPGDIELFPGGMSEIPARGAIVGETFANLIGDQFHRIKHGDRFWFQRDGKQGFTNAQQYEIRRSSLARLYCDNVNNPTVRRNMLLIQSLRNPELTCDQIPAVNLELWRERTEGNIGGYKSPPPPRSTLRLVQPYRVFSAMRSRIPSARRRAPLYRSRLRQRPPVQRVPHSFSGYHI